MVVKRSSTKDILEKEKDPRYESILVKYPREEPIDISKRRSIKDADPDDKKLEKAINEHPNKKYSFIHTHPYTSDPKPKAHAPLRVSPSDWEYFLADKNAKSMTIAQRDTSTGEVRGSVTISKTKNTPEPDDDVYNKNNTLISNAIGDYQSGCTPWFEGKQIIDSLKNIAKKLHLRAKYIPAKGFHISTEDRGEFHFKRNKSLESKLAVASILMIFFSGIFFLPNNITGNVIGDLTNSTLNILGIILLVIGLTTGYFYLKRRRL